MYERILIANDASEKTEDAVNEAIDLAKTTQAELHSIFVINSTAFESIPESGLWTKTKNILNEEGEEANQEVYEKCTQKDITCKTKILEGIPDKEIIDYAEENQIDLIVMGTSSKKGVDRFLLGSVAEKVLRASDIPVLVVRPNKGD
ncbi:universal stress protein [archaeon SCG-AAA382B04]|nr:universal stress protein [archaeon SCG-AAA382B04]